MARKLIDANVILRYLLRDDEELFGKAFEILEKVKIGQETVIIPESVLAEVVYVLLKIYEVTREVIVEKLQGLLSYRGVINPDKVDLAEAFRMFGSTKLSFVDCVLCAKAISHRMELFTFDGDLKKVLNSNMNRGSRLKGKG
jgi:predicted nucleic acid-binding protein